MVTIIQCCCQINLIIILLINECSIQLCSFVPTGIILSQFLLQNRFCGERGLTQFVEDVFEAIMCFLLSMINNIQISANYLHCVLVHNFFPVFTHWIFLKTSTDIARLIYTHCHHKQCKLACPGLCWFQIMKNLCFTIPC